MTKALRSSQSLAAFGLTEDTVSGFEKIAAQAISDHGFPNANIEGGRVFHDPPEPEDMDARWAGEMARDAVAGAAESAQTATS